MAPTAIAVRGPNTTAANTTGKDDTVISRFGVYAYRLSLGEHGEATECQHRPERPEARPEERQRECKAAVRTASQPRRPNRLAPANERGPHRFGPVGAWILSKASQSSCLSPKRGISSWPPLSPFPRGVLMLHWQSRLWPSCVAGFPRRLGGTVRGW